jgi:hypothetical protein
MDGVSRNLKFRFAIDLPERLQSKIPELSGRGDDRPMKLL